MISSVTIEDRRRLTGEHEEDHRRGDPMRGGAGMTIRAKLYAAIVLTVLGPLATTAVALHGMAQMGDRFDEVRERAEREAVARELKFLVTDVNGWQTAYGYARGRVPRPLPRLGRRARRELDARRGRAHRPAGAGADRAARRPSSARSWTSTPSPGGRSRPGDREDETDPARARAAAVRGDGGDRRRARRAEARAGRGHRGRLRPGPRRRPPAADRGRARRRAS